MGVIQLLDTQRQQKFYVSFTKTKTKNNCLKFLVNRIITELLLQCIEWLRNTFCTCFIEENSLTLAGKCDHVRKYIPVWPRSRWAVGEISVRGGNFQIKWIEISCWWKLPSWRDLVGLFPRLRGIIFLIWAAPKVTSLKFKDYKRIPPIPFYAPGHTNPHQAMPTHIRPRQPTPTHTRLYQPTPVRTSPHQVTSGHTYTVELVQLNQQ